jgi:4-methyl-5(b-hydroxyethyl)-thiazole monophosphate biosynthesis
MKTLIPVAVGSEDMETAILADLFRRAGWPVTLAGLSPGPIRCARGMMLVPDEVWEKVDPAGYGLIVLPGGMPGVDAMRRHAGLREALRRAAAEGRWIGALCAAPLVLADAGLLDGRRATCYPGLEKGVSGPLWTDEPVVKDGHIMTSRGPGTCFAFALALIRELDGAARADEVARAAVYSG